MKKKTLSSILVIGLICISLTGCVSFSYGNPVKEETYVAELPDGEVVVLDKEEAEELQRAQDELQEELGISDEELEALREDIAGYEDEDYEEETETETETVENPYAKSYVFGSSVATSIEYLGVRYDIYENGATLTRFLDEFGTLQETIEYEGIEYPVIGIEWISDREEFVIPDFIKYIYIDDTGSSTGLKNLVIPDTVTYYEISLNQEAIENIEFPENVPTNKIWKANFYQFGNLQTISVPNGVEVLEKTFNECSSLTEVHLPDTLVEIRDWTFRNCINLSEITIPDTVTTIGYSAFENTNISSITLPSNLTSFEMSAVKNCPIEELIFPDTVTTCIGDVSELPNLKKIVFPDNLELTSLYIWECPNLELVVFPDSIQEISFDSSDLNNPSNCTFEVPAEIAEYYQNKFPEINVVAKE